MTQRRQFANLGKDVMAVGIGTITALGDECRSAYAPQQLDNFTDCVVTVHRRAANGAAARACQKYDGTFGAVRQPDADALALLHAAPREVCRQCIGHANELAVRDAAKPLANRELVGSVLCMRAHERVDRIIAPKPGGIVAIDQLGAEQGEERIGHQDISIATTDNAASWVKITSGLKALRERCGREPGAAAPLGGRRCGAGGRQPWPAGRLVAAETGPLVRCKTLTLNA